MAEYFDLQLNATSTSKDSGYDFLIELDDKHGGLDSKGYTHNDPRLLVVEGSVNADYYILSRVNLDNYEVDCEEQSCHVSPNRLVRERASMIDHPTNVESPTSTDRVSVDLLGWATSEMILDAEVMRHNSSSSHTLPVSQLYSLPPPDTVDSYNPSFDYPP